MPLLPLALQSRPGLDNRAYSGERLFNYFARPTEGGVSPATLMARGGLVQHVALGGPVRAVTSMGGALYAIANGKVWKIVAGVATSVGTVSDGVTRVAVSASEIAIVVGRGYYICDGSTTTAYPTGSITDPVGVTFMDGYFIVAGSSAGRGDAITVSGLDNGTTFDTLDFAFAEESPDAIVSIRRDHSRVWLFGERTVQVFYNSGNVDFPFQPVPGALIEHGAQQYSDAAADNMVYWVRPDGTVLRSGGDAPQIISTPEVRAEIGTVTAAFSFTERGHEFYAVCQADKPTLVFDMVTGLWHERVSGLSYAPWKATDAYQFEGTAYYACTGGQVATADPSTHTDFGDVLINEVITSPIQRGARRFTIARLHVEMSDGTTDIGRTAKVMMQTSRDGATWGFEDWADLAGKGAFYKRAVWHALGQFRKAQFRLRVTDAVARDIYGGEFE